MGGKSGDRHTRHGSNPVKIRWTGKAVDDLARLHTFLNPVAPDAAAQVVSMLARAPERLLGYPRLGSPLDDYAPREVRKLTVGRYELRYEIAGDDIIVLRIWQGREART